MITFLRGKLVEKTPSMIILDVGGVGYEVLISLNTYDRLPHTNSECFIHTHYHVREDVQILYGFARPEEKRLFQQLVGVNGVGPKTAITALSGMSVSDMTRAITESDIKRLSTIHGIGKKTAERIVVELRDKLDPLEVLAAGQSADENTVRTTMLRDATLALMALGFAQEQARKMVRQTADDHEEINDVEALLRKTLSTK